MKTYQGIAASPGFAVGPVHPVGQRTIVPRRRLIAAEQVGPETDRFKAGVEQAKSEIRALQESLERELGPDVAGIISAQLLILEDELVWDATLAVIRLDRINAEAAFSRAVGDVAARFMEIEDETFRDRVHDLQDVEQRVLRALSDDPSPGLAVPLEPSVIVARNLTPTHTAALGRENVLGFAMDEGGNTSHVAILARSLGVPAVVGVGGPVAQFKAGDLLAVNGTHGELIADPDPETVQMYQAKQVLAGVENEKLAGLKDLEAMTPDGHRIRLMANVELPLELDEALARGAEGVGLLRTEYLFFQHQSIPTEDQQTAVYTDMVERMGGKPIIFRTLDVGGDKVTDYLGAKREYNPFLGWRGIRFSLANRPMFKTQIKALLRAGAAGPIKIMFPMITGVGELREAKDVVAEAADDLRNECRDFQDNVEIGIMIETPAAVLAADLLARECDFFSIGSNDLIQYTLAMDRGNSRVSYLYQPLHPAILRSIRHTVEAGHKAGIWVGICGEMGSETRLAEVLLGLGLDEISLHGAALPKIKQVVRWTSMAEARQVAEALMAQATADEANAWLADYIARRKKSRQEETPA